MMPGARFRASGWKRAVGRFCRISFEMLDTVAELVTSIAAPPRHLDGSRRPSRLESDGHVDGVAQVTASPPGAPSESPGAIP